MDKQSTYAQYPFVVDRRLAQWIRDIRRHIHTFPEVSFEEHRTAAYVQEKLKEIGIDSRGEVAGTGVVAVVSGPLSRTSGVALAGRYGCPANQRRNGVAVSFAGSPGLCMPAAMTGMWRCCLVPPALLQSRDLPGPVTLIFQPAEEHGNGAWHMVNNGVLNNVEAVFAGHIDTHFAVGTITIDEGIVCAWADPLRSVFPGKAVTPPGRMRRWMRLWRRQVLLCRCRP